MNEAGSEPGREAASKERRRARIVAAATGLLDERGAGGFTVDEVAAKAEVSRRTVFNYFSSMDALVIELGTRMVSGLIQAFEESVPNGQAAHCAESSWRAGVFSDLVTVLNSVDLVGPMIRLTGAFGEGRPADPRVAAIVQEALSQIIDRLAGKLCQRYPAADRLAVELQVASLIGGVIVLYGHWAQRTELEDTAASRRVWSELLQKMISQAGRGPLDNPRPPGRRPSAVD
ncbi:MAG: TetR/AcrR family transcriptional regulator; helix-turn-helix transcriptional regulator [Bifidobacteriaceae bacterium]|jgi:AcrR family transcriptional regulator|nr:TetR/AcrR family transcriptional regulator; helix-turn-helix transcriptional regulator [Bifidobacteriaceae bacterium]